MAVACLNVGRPRHHLSDETRYRLLKLLAERPDVSQRQLAASLGISLGKVNYCVRALLDKGWIKVANFRNSRNKLAYVYLLTPSGVDAKARITASFLQRKLAEYDALKAEIDQMTAELAQSDANTPETLERP